MQSYNSSPWNLSQTYTDPSNPYVVDRNLGRRRQTLPEPQHHPTPKLPPPPLPISRSHSAEPPPLPPLPPSLTPGGRIRGQSKSTSFPDLFFEQPVDYALARQGNDEASIQPQPLYSSGLQRHTQSFTAGVTRYNPPPPPLKPVELQASPPPLPPKQIAGEPPYSPLPTVPPKISLYPQSIPGPVGNPSQQEKTPLASSLQRDGDRDLEMAMLLSEAEANERKQEMYDQEEDDLARALEESRISVFETSSSPASPVNVEVVEPDNAVPWDVGTSTPSHTRLHPLSLMPTRPMVSDENLMGKTPVEREPSSPQILATRLSDDEAFARRLAAGEDPESIDDHTSPSQESAQTDAQSSQSLYSDVVSNIVNAPAHSASHSVDYSRSESAIPEPPLSRDNSIRSTSSQKSARSGQRSNSVNPGPLSINTPVPAQAVTAESSSLSPSWPSAASEKRSLSIMSSESTTPLMDGSPSIHANQFVEQELLLGVSMGFAAPAISTILKPMQGPMPNIITLPYGKAPPLHLQAPSWRHLLKLMARLSGTRIEPTLEAMAVSNGELKLRTVVQFVKLHHSAREWRMILYLTIDHPVPSNAQNAWKFTNGDVCTLPYSYNLSVLPALLRDGADSAVATYYVIPATSKTPYPTLPINFPDMAMYLQSALQDSRKAMHDSSSGLRKLAKCVDSYYANEHEFVGVEEDPEKLSIGGVFRKVIRRGNKQGKGNRGGNEEVYDLVTPFVPEEWG